MRRKSLGGPNWRRLIAASVIVALAALPTAVSAGPIAKNVVIMISDGAGYNAWDAASYYAYGALGQQPYDAFPVHYGCTTWMLHNGQPQGYDPAQMWSDPNYVKRGNTIRTDGSESQNYIGFTDSAAAATALYTGHKTYKGAMGVDKDGNPLKSIAQYADELGKATGTISSVQASHATPAALWSHNPSRNNYADIFNEMVNSGLDVVMGCGHPLYTNDNAQGFTKDTDGDHVPDDYQYKYVGGQATWNGLKDVIDGVTTDYNGFDVIDSKTDFEAIADGTYVPDKVVGIAQCISTLQASRSANGAGGGFGNPSGDAFNADVPTLETMTKATLNVLAQDPDGFLCMVEGGAVDWANHANDLPRMIEEQLDFNASVQAVVDWVEANSNWDETLVIVTADHECGMLWGGDSFDDNDANGYYDELHGSDVWNDWADVLNAGQGTVPAHQYCSGGHTNALVPLWAIGPKSYLFDGFAIGTDPTAPDYWGPEDWEGAYVDNTSVFFVAHSAMTPEPASLTLIGIGLGLAVIRRKRRA